jgi:heat shock protein HslJ
MAGRSMPKASRFPVLALCAAALLGAAPAPGQQPARPAQEPAPPEAAPEGKPVQPPPRVGDELVGTRWRADTLAGAPVADPALVTIDFLPGDHVRGQAGCNRFVGPFASRARRITIGWLRQSRLKCPPEEAALQRRVIATLHVAERAELGEDTLTLYGPAGEASRFVPRPE